MEVGVESRTVAQSRINQNRPRKQNRTLDGCDIIRHKQKGGSTLKAESQSRKQNVSDDTITDIVKQKQKRNRPDLANFGEENAEPGDNTRYLRFAMASLNLPPIDISDPKQVQNRILEYLNFCADNDRKPNIKGLGNWLGVDATTVNSWRRGEYRTETHSPLIKKAVDILEEMWWDYGQNGKCNPASWIFIGKNAFGMRDEQQVVITPNNPYDTQSDEELSGKYLTGSVKAE